MTASNIYFNKAASTYAHHSTLNVPPKSLHVQLPDFRESPLTEVSDLFPQVGHVFIKDESERMGLPSFKILGASWGTFRTIAKEFNLPLNSEFATIGEAAQDRQIHLVTATDGNHGRAVSRMARLLGVPATIFVPQAVNEYTRDKIRGEGAQVIVDKGDYDSAVKAAYEYGTGADSRLFIQDTSFEGYHEIPQWIVEGYTTMLLEVEDQLKARGLTATHVFTPVGVGSLAHAVVAHCKGQGRNMSVTAVEPEAASCLLTSLRSGSIVSVQTSDTIMDGMNCGTVSEISWPVLKEGVGAALSISDRESDESVQTLASIGINAGPCGASTTAALKKIMNLSNGADFGIGKDSVVVLLCTEGSREYTVPV